MDRLLSMRVFQKVVDESSFAAAARALAMSPVGVTRLVSDLEQHLGTRLIQRTTRKLVLTDAGQAYLIRVRSILQEVDDAEAAASRNTSELQGVVNVLASSMLANYFVARQMSNWLARYPKVALHLHVDPYPLARVEEFDVTFISVNEGFDASIVARLITQTDYVICASPDYLRRHTAPNTPQDLQCHPYLRFAWQAGSGYAARGMRLTSLDGSQGDVEVTMPVVFQAESYEALFAAAVAGAGVAALPRFPASNYFESGELTHLLPDWIFGRFKLYAALPTRKLMPARTRAFLDFASEVLL